MLHALEWKNGILPLHAGRSTQATPHGRSMLDAPRGVGSIMFFNYYVVMRSTLMVLWCGSKVSAEKVMLSTVYATGGGATTDSGACR